MNLIRKPIYPDDNLVCNNRNIHEYTPYIITLEGNIIDQNWWNSLTDHCKNIICQRTNNNFKLGDVTIPHDFQFDNETKFLTIMYKSYIDAFDYNIWWEHLAINNIKNSPTNVSMFQVSADLKKLFVEIYDNNKPYSDLADNPFLLEFRNNIATYINPGEQYFIRMSSTSGKNEKYVKPFESADEIVAHIASVKLFVDQEFRRDNKDSYLIAMQWNENIDTRYEFRIFVVNNKLVAISQQNKYELYQYSSIELDIIEHALNNISFLDSGPYPTYVGDVYVDMETKICCLIEFNPFGVFSGAGAALFNWRDDYDILHGLTNMPPEFRYLSIINY